MKSFFRFFLIVAIALISSGTGICSQRRTRELVPLYDRFGNVISVSNQYDGNSYAVRITQADRNGSMHRDQLHSDGYQEVATSVYVGDDGNVYITGTRYWQGQKYLWEMKYYPDTNWSWEWADNQPNCMTPDIVSNDAGDSWVAASCNYDNTHAMRLVHLNEKGYFLWDQIYSAEGNGDVQTLNIDSGNRVSVTLGPGNRNYDFTTVVYDGDGRQKAIY